jgi:hypothetical protein
MEVYRHNGQRVRHELEVILGTWKHPPQGSRDPRPVLPPDITGKIESAVTAFRNIAMQHQAPAQQYRPRENPTPVPNPANVADLLRSVHQRSTTPTFPMNSAYVPPPAIPQPPAHQYQFTPPLINQSDLQLEVKDVLQDASLKSMLEPNNHDLKQLIETLKSLKTVLDSTPLGQPTLQQMRSELAKIRSRLHSQLSSLLANAPHPQVLPSHTSTPIPFPVVSTPPAVMNNAPPPAIPPQFDINSIFNILQPSSTPTPVPMSNAPPPIGNSLFDQLRAAGLLSANSTPQPNIIKSHNPNASGVVLDQDSIKM